MLWKTHKHIIFAISEELDLSNVKADRLIEGVLAPDKWKDYSHHHGRPYTIQERLLKARQLFLNDDELNRHYHLEVAFHNIHDAYTSFVWRSRDSNKRHE